MRKKNGKKVMVRKVNTDVVTVEPIRIRWFEVERAVQTIAEAMDGRAFKSVIALHDGGLVPAKMLAAALGAKSVVVWDGANSVGELIPPALIVDDILETETATAKARCVFGCPVAVIVAKRAGADYWGIEMDLGDSREVIFPWVKAAVK